MTSTESGAGNNPHEIATGMQGSVWRGEGGALLGALADSLDS